MIPALIISMLLGVVGIVAWSQARKRSHWPLAADIALFAVIAPAIGIAICYVVFRVLNYSVIMHHTSDPAGFAAGMFFAGLFLLMSLGVGAFVAGVGFLILRRDRAKAGSGGSAAEDAKMRPEDPSKML